uniref:Oleosin 2 n=1 Tax=Carthamus tinctorius TaxID=4222 RepID=A0A7R6LUW1_CARTI|nr:oleosin 2 [Carthamus tinctorius]
MAHNHHQFHQQQPASYQVAKATTALTLGVSLTLLSGLTMSATVIGLVLLTPLLLIFSPVLVPAVITSFLIIAGVMTSGLLGMSAVFVFFWTYNYASGKHPIGADRLDRARERIAGAAMKMKGQFGHHNEREVGHSTR